MMIMMMKNPLSTRKMTLDRNKEIYKLKTNRNDNQISKYKDCFPYYLNLFKR